MANGRSAGQKYGRGRDAGGFIALPWVVMKSAAYLRLSHPARSLLWELALQLSWDNNGRLLASRGFLKERGWLSADVIHRAKAELINEGFIFETVKGYRPNKASWYAVTWRVLDRHPDFDPGAEKVFQRGAYARTHGRAENEVLSPPGGLVRPAIAPSGGLV